MAPPQKRRSLLTRFVTVVATVPILALAATLLLASDFWVGDMLTFFMPWIALAGLGSLALAMVFRLRVVSVAAAGLCIVAAVPIFGAWSQPPPAIAGTSLRVMTFNTLVGTADPDELMAHLEAEVPDVLVLQEYSLQLDSELADPFAAMFPYRSDAGQSALPTLLLLSRYPIAAVDVIGGTVDPRGRMDQSALRVEITVGAQTAIVYAVHAPTPRWGDRAWQARNALLETLANRAAAEPAGTAVIVAGDFNTPTWSPFFLKLVGEAGLSDTAGRLLPSPTRLIDRAGFSDVFGAPVDHILVSARIGWQGDRIGPDLGSDHRPVTTDLVLPN